MLMTPGGMPALTTSSANLSAVNGVTCVSVWWVGKVMVCACVGVGGVCISINSVQRT